MTTETKYDRSFYERPPDEVARDLVGSLLVLRDGVHEARALIVETEAYGGPDDAASHAYRGLTKRNAAMFGPPGHLYVYRIYGLHWCMNVVTQAEGVASAVLLRAADLLSVPVNGMESRATPVPLRGPGNLTRGLGVTGDDNGRDCVNGTGRTIALYEQVPHDLSARVGCSPRIGISRETQRQSRYFLVGHTAVSGPRKVP